MQADEYRRHIGNVIHNAEEAIGAGLRAVAAINPNCKGISNRDANGGYVLLFKDGVGIRVDISIDHLPEGVV